MTTIRRTRTCTNGAGPDNGRCQQRSDGLAVPLPGALATDVEGRADDRPAHAGGSQSRHHGDDVGV